MKSTRTRIKGSKKRKLSAFERVWGGFSIAIVGTILLSMQGWHTTWWTVLGVFVFWMVASLIESHLKNEL